MAETDRNKDQGREETRAENQMNEDGAVNIPIEDGDAENASPQTGETADPQNSSDDAGNTKTGDDVETADAGEKTEEAQEADPSSDSDQPKETETSEADEDDDDDEEGAVDGEWKSLDGKESSAGSSGSGFFKKKEKKDKKDIQIEELTDRVRRQMAEFDNFRKRTEKEKSQMFEVGAKSVIEKILPIVDSFERGLAVADKSDPFVEGMEKTYRQLMTTLESLDVKPIEAVGKEFDPNLHNAVMHVDDDSVGDNIVVEELQKGYTYRGSVVRYSMVKVAN